MVYNVKAFGLPKMKLADRETILQYSTHAKREALNDKFGVCTFPKTVNFAKVQVVEVEVLDNHITKFVIRGSMDSSRDLLLVVNPDGFVRTMWINLKSDNHRTLNVNNYSRP